MFNTLPISLLDTDLAGSAHPSPNLMQMQRRIRILVNRYLTDVALRDRLEDLPRQFQTPQPRPWKRIDWQGIDATQIRGIEPLVFLAILAGAADTEEPIRGYTQASRQYLEPLHPPMARFVGGTVDVQETLLEPGLWEKEERQHAPALQKIYTQLTGLKLIPVPPMPRPYQPTQIPKLTSTVTGCIASQPSMGQPASISGSWPIPQDPSSPSWKNCSWTKSIT